MPAKNLQQRKIVWEIISRLFLDTAFTDEQYQQMGRDLAATGFSTEALYKIYADEVAPIVWLNLWSPAGVWEGFDPDALEERITKRNLMHKKNIPLITAVVG